MDGRESFYVGQMEVQMFILGIFCEKGEVLHNSLTSNECPWFIFEASDSHNTPKG